MPEYEQEITFQKNQIESIKEFYSMIGIKSDNLNEFTFDSKKWYIDYHPFTHSDDVIIEDNIIDKYDNFLLVKVGGEKTRIAGWTTREELKKTNKRDIYRNGKFFYLVNDVNLKDLTEFKIEKQNKKVLQDKFVINKQTADNYGHKEMISGILAGFHYFAKQANLYFKDINQRDECMLGDKKIKFYTRDIKSDEDMLVYDSYFRSHPDVDYYICIKIKGGNYNYLGYVDKARVSETRVVNMIGQDGDKESEEIRRIFAEQYSPISDLIQIYVEEQEEEKIVMQKYVPLHVHSEFSVGDAFGTPSALASAMKRKGFIGGALTDHGTLAGVWPFQKYMLENNIKPILGIEAYIKIPEFEKAKHLTIWVKNKQGWENLLALQAIATFDHFYYKPLIPVESLFEKHEGLIIGTGCINSLFNSLISENQIEMVKIYFKRFKDVFKDDLYGEIMPTTVVHNQDVMKIAYKLYEEFDIKPIFTNDVHYHDKSQKEIHDAIKAINFKSKFGEAGYGDDIFYLMQEQDINERLETNPENQWLLPIIDRLKQNTFEVLEKVNFEITPPKELDTLPKLGATPEIRKEMLKKLCIEGLKKNTPYEYSGDMKDRLDLEVNRILSKDYENYFLLVHDIIKFAKDNGIVVGPGRGSVGASLAAYALGITTCDPIKFDLLFDRFLSEIRRDMPDVDMDFQDSRRPEIYEYLINRFGRKHCAKVATYARFHPKGVLRDLGRIFEIPIKEVETICGLVIERSGGDARASFSLLDTFEEFEEAINFKNKYPQATRIAIALEGTIRHKGMHAAAMVVTEKEISNYVPLAKISGEIVVEWEKQLAEDMKLNKLDILGLKTLTVIDDCIKSIGDIKLPQTFEDKRVYEKVFVQGKCLGVFQFETVGLSKLSKTLLVDDFKTLHDATTLFRPGALHSGQTMQYVNRKLGKEDIVVEHELLREITKDTRGIILYQEQIMQIMNRIGGMSWATAEMARKVITKSKGKKAFEEMRKEFVTNAGKLHGIETSEAEKLYDVVSTFGSYSFNKAHAVEYSIISYWTAWLKTYFPENFYCAILKHADDETKILSYLQEAESENIKIEYPDINKSDIEYSIYKGTIYSGFTSIKGIGKSTAKKILKHRPYVDFDDFVKKVKPSSSVLKGLIAAECFREFSINCKQKYHGVPEQIQDFTDFEKMELLLEHTTLKPKKNISEVFDFPVMKYFDIAECGENTKNQLGRIRGLVTDVINKDKLLRTDIKNHTFKFEQHMIYLNVNDGTGNMAVQINPWTYTRYKDVIQKLDKKPIVVHGLFSKDGQKIYGELLQVGKTGDVVDYLNAMLDKDTVVISSATPAVSKKGKSYYRIVLSNGVTGMCFRFTTHLIPGMKVKYEKQGPFLDLTVIKK